MTSDERRSGDADNREARFAGRFPLLGEASVALPDAGELAEGPRWITGPGGTALLLWVDILAGRLHSWSPADGTRRVVSAGRMLGCVAPIPGDAEHVLAAATEFDGSRSSLGRVRLSDGAWTTLAPLDVPAGVRCNDGAVDPVGRFWFGTMCLRDEPARGTLYRVDFSGGTSRTDGGVAHALRVTPVLGSVSISNGIGWSPDARRMYYADSPTRRVDVFDFDASTGSISNQRPLWTVPGEFGGAVPDGLFVDAADRVWVALWDGWCVVCLDGHDGSVLGVVRVPAPRVTSCCFGGADDDTLFITTASEGLTDQERTRWPASGCVLTCTLAFR